MATRFIDFLEGLITIQVLTFTFCSSNRWVETLIYIPGRIQGDLDSRRYGWVV
jgi:hypothetical protein